MDELTVSANAEALARQAAERFVALSGRAIEARGRFMVALAGGSTPRPTYRLLSGDPYAGYVDWEAVHVFWGDERCVPPGDRRSNYRMAREALLDHVPISPANVHRIRGEDDPDRAAAAYEGELKSLLGGTGRFDLIFLGLGGDGHTASLFPGTAALDERRRWVVANYVEKRSAWRITLTLPIINAARHVVFLVSGERKAHPLSRVFSGSVPLPATRVQPEEGELKWLVDEAAASAF